VEEYPTISGEGNMEQNVFEKSVDQTRLDRLRGSILAAVSEFEYEGFDNMEIARALVGAGYTRARREKNSTLWESFMQFCRDTAAQSLVQHEVLGRTLYDEMEKQKIN
jgi:hypothetical protein